MRFGVMIAAAAAMLCAGQASAEVFNVSISGFFTGTQATFGCGPGTSAYCSVSSPFAGYLGTPQFLLDLHPGANAVQVGTPGTIGVFEGTIINTSRALTGLNFTYYSNPCARGSAPTAGCVNIERAFAPVVSVQGGVPEPATWAMMILGLGAAGFAMRRRRAKHYTPAIL